MPKKTTIRPDQTLARWTRNSLSLIVRLSGRGVHSISLENYDPQQKLLWSDIGVPVVDLAAVTPFGPDLAAELAVAIEGRPFTPTVPWVSDGPPWHTEVYRELLRLPRGRLTDVFAVVPGYKLRQTRPAILRIIRRCPLVPVVPVHRAANGNRPLPFPWKRRWRDYLLDQERQHQTDQKGDTP